MLVKVEDTTYFIESGKQLEAMMIQGSCVDF